MHGRIDKAEESIKWFKNLFGEDYYLEMQRHETHDPNADCTIFPHQQEVNKVLIELAHKHNIKLIATNDVHFVNADDAEAHDRLICLSTGKDLDDPQAYALLQARMDEDNRRDEHHLRRYPRSFE